MNVPVPVPIANEVFVTSTGFGVVAQTIPLVILASPPSLLTLPPIHQVI